MANIAINQIYEVTFQSIQLKNNMNVPVSIVVNNKKIISAMKV